MAQGQAMAGPFGAARGIISRAAEGATRNIRLTVMLCLVLICGSFAAATLVQMRLERSQALAQAQAFETRRAEDIAVLTARELDRYAQLGRAFAANPGAVIAAPGLRNIAVFNAQGVATALLHGDPRAITAPAGLFTGRRTLLPSSVLAIPDHGGAIAVFFDPALLVPPAMLTRAALMLPAGAPLAAGAQWDDRAVITRPVPGWPLMAATSLDKKAALLGWRGTLPLYLFIILGPVLVGICLAIFFVQEFECRAKARAAIRNLKTLRPVEAKLLVRLAHAERNAVESLRAKSEFIAHMSHELRTPLNAIIGFSEIIAQDMYGPVGHPKYGEYARDIGTAGRALHARIGDILEFANVEAGRWPLRIARLDVAAIAQAVVDEHAGRAFSRRIALDLGFGEPAEARADALAVQRILTNLVSNALLYTAEGGTVRLDVTSEEGAVVILVRDSGPGFTPNERRSAGGAFQCFSRTGAVTGNGLGLAIAMGLARRMGGAVQMAGAPDGGNAMELRLPKA
jgi:signal transduction histidine kinase